MPEAASQARNKFMLHPGWHALVVFSSRHHSIRVQQTREPQKMRYLRGDQMVDIDTALQVHQHGCNRDFAGWNVSGFSSRAAFQPRSVGACLHAVSSCQTESCALSIRPMQERLEGKGTHSEGEWSPYENPQVPLLRVLGLLQCLLAFEGGSC